MRIPFSWLAEHCDTGLEPEVLAEKLAMTGTEIERVVINGPESNEGFVIGRVLSIEKHPDADRLTVCRVDTGDAGSDVEGSGGSDDEGPGRQIVCGAPNVAAGQTVVVALPGAIMPGGMKIRKAKLRGAVSEGMICSESELELGDGTDGIMVLEDGPAPGTLAVAVLPLGERVLELEVTPNRPDCLGLYGVAREAHAITRAGLGVKPWDGGVIGPGIDAASIYVDGAGYTSAGTGAESNGAGADIASARIAALDRISVTVADHELCPRFTARGFTDVTVRPSPLWLQARLIAAGQRPINNVVDITNYVMWLTGQPLHAFDLDLIPDGELEVRPAKSGEKVTTLDGIERNLDPSMTVIADRDNVASIAGVMGGSVSEVSATTITVMIESATWNGPDILRTSRDLALRSEASSRYEKQLHPALALRAQAVATRLMVALCGATPMAGTVDVAGPEPAARQIRLRAGRVEQILGLVIPIKEQQRGLFTLGFEVEHDGDDLLVTVPPDRHFDVTREIDLVEEIGRINDLDRRLPATLPSGSGRVGGLSRQQVLQRRTEDVMREAGFNEIVGWSFTDPGETVRLRLVDPDPRSQAVRLSNPLSEDQSVMRTTLVGSVLDAARRNLSRGLDHLALFESGRVYLPVGDTGPGPLGGDFPGVRRPPVNEPQHLCAVTVGSIDPVSWSQNETPSGFFALKGVLEHLAASLGTGISILPPEDPAEQPFLHPGRVGRILIEGREAGWIGEIHPAIAADLDLGAATAFEFSLADLLATSPLGEETYHDFTAFPPIDRDLAVVIPEDASAADVTATIRAAGGELLTGVTIFDLYRGDQIATDEKSLALRLRFRADDRTLSDEEIDPAWQTVIESLNTIGGRLRG